MTRLELWLYQHITLATFAQVAIGSVILWLASMVIR